MARRSFSWLLARRYLNPRRAHFSAVAIISVTGVLLGVLVLVVVMSVYSGLEREVKGRLLGFIPHIKLEYSPFGGQRESVADWQDLAERVAAVDGIQSTAPFVQDNVGIDIGSWQSAGIFRGIDTANPADVAGIEAMLDTTDFPGGSADMGLDDRVVISSKIARSFGAGIGDTIRLYSWRNFDEVKRVFDATNRPPVRDEFAAGLEEARRLLATGGTVAGDERSYPADTFAAAYNRLWTIYGENIREPERQIVEQALIALDRGREAEPGGAIVVPAETPEEVDGILAQLDDIDPDKIDGELLKNLREVVLPKEAEIVGVYQSSEMALTPGVFMPLHLAQDLAGLEGGVQAISVKLDDPYQAALIAQQIEQELPEGWRSITWISEISDFSRLLNQQRVMMYFALSFIILVSAFSMTAVMFTMTIQKRREIGVMKALGAAQGQIVRVFVHQGMILGFFGAILGAGLGLVVIHFRGSLQAVMRKAGFDPFPASFHGFQILPAHINPLEIAVIAGLAFLLCAGAALIPAFFAARSDAARSLRNL